MTTKLFILFLMLLSHGCQKRPMSGPASDNMSPLLEPPMGAQVTNDELKEELRLLDLVLGKKIEETMFVKAKQRAMTASKDLMDTTAGHNDEIRLAKLFIVVPELLYAREFSANQQKWLKAKFLFLQRRFVEASILLSEVVNDEPTFFPAKNFLARSLFFLGNPDLAFMHLQNIVQNASKKEEKMDALYLQGAMVSEMGEVSPETLRLGIKAWESYLTMADEEHVVTKEVKKSLLTLRERLNPLKTVMQAAATTDIFEPNERYKSEVNSVLTAFKKEELLLAERLADHVLSKGFDKLVMLVKARIFIKTTRMEEAEALFKELTKKEPNYAPAWHYQGMVFMLKGDAKSAIASWQTTLKLDKAYGDRNKLSERIAVAQGMLTPQKVPSH